MPPGLPMRPAPRTSTPVIGARDFLLHHDGAVDETTRETQAHFQLAVSIWHMLEHKLRTPDIPLSAEFDKLYACHAHSGQEVCPGAPASAHVTHVACRLRESSCSRLLSGETAAQAAARAAAGPYQLGWVPCGSRLGRTRPAGPALYVLNNHEPYTRGTSPRASGQTRKFSLFSTESSRSATLSK